MKQNHLTFGRLNVKISINLKSYGFLKIEFHVKRRNTVIISLAVFNFLFSLVILQLFHVLQLLVISLGIP